MKLSNLFMGALVVAPILLGTAKLSGATDYIRDLVDGGPENGGGVVMVDINCVENNPDVADVTKACAQNHEF